MTIDASRDAVVLAVGEGGKTAGHYQIAGWILQRTFDERTTERRSITWQRDPDAIWINGPGFVR
jgi:hypothetical protein